MISRFYNKHLLPRHLARALSSSKLHALREKVANQATWVVAEIGFWAGYNYPYYDSNKVQKIYAIEPSKEEIRKFTPDSAIPVEICSTWAENTWLPDSSVDTCVSFLTLCSVASIYEALEEIERILVPGWTFVFCDHGKHPNKWIAVAQKLGTPFSKSLCGGCHMDRDILAHIEASNLSLIHHKAEQSFKWPLIHITSWIAIKV